MIKFFFGLLLVSTSFKSIAWNSVGHRLIAQIAYDHLNKKTKRLFNHDNQVLNQSHRSYNLVNAAVWMDQLYAEEYKSLRPMHYIDLPFSPDSTALPKVPQVNAVFAINLARKTLLNSESSPLERAIAVRILWHVVGDIHQPLHASTRVSSDSLTGDEGGNLYKLLQNPIANNLHSYWDKGGGLLNKKTRYRSQDIKRMATKIEQHWFCNINAMDLNPMHWAEESHRLAVQEVYTNVMGIGYQHRVKAISNERIALAGCRLAAISMQIAASQAHQKHSTAF